MAGHVWHITERCHRKEFLLKFARDRRAWAGWLYEARKRFGLCVLNYQVTCNHVHLLVRDRGGEIERSMQLVAGCTGQAYNRRKRRRGASTPTDTPTATPTHTAFILELSESTQRYPAPDP